MIKKNFRKLRFIQLFMIIVIVNLVWLLINQVQNGNMWDTYFNVFNSVYIYALVFLPGLLCFIETNIRKNKVNIFINIRIKSKLEKVKDTLKTVLFLSVLYSIAYFVIVFVILGITQGFTFSWSEVTINGENSNTIFYQNIQPHMAALLLALKYLILAVNVACCFAALEVLLGKFKMMMIGLYILASACFDFSSVPILSVFYIGNDNTYLLAGNLMEIVKCFCIQNSYLVVMGILYWIIAKQNCSKINLERI